MSAQISYPAFVEILNRVRQHPGTSSTLFLAQALRSYITNSSGPVLGHVDCLDDGGYDAFIELLRYRRRDGHWSDWELQDVLIRLNELEARP